MYGNRGRRIIADEVEAADLVKSPHVGGSMRARASRVMGRGNKLFHPSGRLIRGPQEASEIMQRAYSATAHQLHSQMRDHELDMNLLHGNADHSNTRDFAQLLFTAASADPNTEVQDTLLKSANPQLNSTPYNPSDRGGGFIAHEVGPPSVSKGALKKHSKAVAKAKKKGVSPPPSPRPTRDRTQRNIEFHPPAPGSQHTTQPFGSLHGSYLRPATQPSQRKNRERVNSIGSHNLDHGNKMPSTSPPKIRRK